MEEQMFQPNLIQVQLDLGRGSKEVEWKGEEDLLLKEIGK